MQEHMEKVIIYGGGGVALLFYAWAAWKGGRAGFGNRFLSFNRAGYITRDEKPGLFKGIITAYILAGCALLGVAAYHGLQ